MKFETAVKEIVPRTYNVKSFRFPKPEALKLQAWAVPDHDDKIRG